MRARSDNGRRCAEIKGKKRHISVDTLGLLLTHRHPGRIQDRDEAFSSWRHCSYVSLLKTLFVDQWLSRTEICEAVQSSRNLTLNRQTFDQVSGFVVLPKRWIVDAVHVDRLNSNGGLHRAWPPSGRRNISEAGRM